MTARLLVSHDICTTPTRRTLHNGRAAMAPSSAKSAKTPASRGIPHLLLAALVPIAIVACIASVDRLVASKSFLWTPEEVAAVARKATGLPPEQLLSNVTAELNALHPGRVDAQPELIFINAGGWMGGMALLYATTTEYVLLFGTAMETSGHSGRYWAEITDWMLTGEYRQWPEGSFSAEVHKPGDVIVHKRWEAAGVHWGAGTWMLEYGRGVLPSTLPFALADTVLSSLDVLTVWKTLSTWARLAGGELLWHLNW